MPYRKSQPHTSKFMPQAPCLMNLVREVLRNHHYSLRKGSMADSVIYSLSFVFPLMR